MTILATKRHPLKFYGTVILGSLFFFAIGSLIMFKSIDILQKDQPSIKEYFMPVFSILVYFLAFSMANTYRKNSPQIIIDEHTIKIGNQTYCLKDIKDITLTGKMSFRFILPFPMEGTAIFFNDGTKKILFDDMYSNSSELKSFLEQCIKKARVYTSIDQQNK